MSASVRDRFLEISVRRRGVDTGNDTLLRSCVGWRPLWTNLGEPGGKLV